MNGASHEQRVMLAEAALLALRAYRDDVLVEFDNGQMLRLENLTSSHDDGADYAEVIGNVTAAQSSPEALRFFTGEVVSVTDPKTGETVFRIPSDLRTRAG